MLTVSVEKLLSEMESYQQYGCNRTFSNCTSLHYGFKKKAEEKDLKTEGAMKWLKMFISMKLLLSW